jgi:hypothetical protein
MAIERLTLLYAPLLIDRLIGVHCSHLSVTGASFPSMSVRRPLQ